MSRKDEYRFKNQNRECDIVSQAIRVTMLDIVKNFELFIFMLSHLGKPYIIPLLQGEYSFYIKVTKNGVLKWNRDTEQRHIKDMFVFLIKTKSSLIVFRLVGF